MRPALSLLAGLLLVACGPKNTEPAEGGSDLAPASAEAAEPDPAGEAAEAAPAAEAEPASAPADEAEPAAEAEPEAEAEPGSEADDAGTGDRAAPTKGALTCPGITSGLDAWLRGEPGSVVVDAQGRASVVVTVVSPDTALPDTFAVSRTRQAEATGSAATSHTAYGHIAPDDLCALAATEGVEGVRAAAAASPK